ncbi:MAG: site-2 protease family protein [Thermoflexales bacterium]
MENPSPPASALDAPQEMLLLRARAADVLDIAGSESDAQGETIQFSGRLRVTPEDAFSRLKRLFGEVGFFPLLRDGRSAGESIIVAVRGSLTQSTTGRKWVNALLFGLTLVTVTLGGGSTLSMMRGEDVPAWQSVLANGIPFAIGLMLILGAHEFGHYVQARRHGLPASLPFFIPMPFGLGTLGAFVQMRGAVENKRALFDVAVGGPIAGLLVAIPMFVAAILEPALSGQPLPNTRSLLAEGLISLFRPEASVLGIEVTPLLFAARIGLVLTAMNLLPLGQLDGGLIAYAALGRRRAYWLGWAVLIGLCGIAVVTRSSIWIIWIAFALISGASQATPLDDVTPLDLRRNVAFLATTALLLTLFTARPF